MELIIKKAVKEDAREIIEYSNIVGGESDNLTFELNEFPKSVEEEEKYIEETNSSDTSALFAGRIDGEIACVGSVTSSTRARIAHNCDIGISVKKKFWGMGVGTKLMEEIISFAKQSGKLEIIHLGVRADNERAIALYKKTGFEEIGTDRKYFKIDGQYFDSILMNLYL